MTKRNVQTALFIDEIERIFKEHSVHRLIDATFGEGGHGLYFASKGYTVLGVEWDQEMYEAAKERIATDGLAQKVTMVQGNFRDLKEMPEVKAGGYDAIIVDLGLSMKQIRDSGRGFTFMGDEPLDLRISTKTEETAAKFIKSNSKEILYDYFTKYIEDVATPRFVDALVEYRYHHEITSTKALKEIIEKLSMTNKQQTVFLRKVLQGLRMIVNDEVENLREMLNALPSLIKQGGVVCILTFHSVEDRIVKLFFMNNQQFTSLEKPVRNARFSFATSAQLRAYIKK